MTMKKILLLTFVLFSVIANAKVETIKIGSFKGNSHVVYAKYELSDSIKEYTDIYVHYKNPGYKHINEYITFDMGNKKEALSTLSQLKLFIKNNKNKVDVSCTIGNVYVLIGATFDTPVVRLYKDNHILELASTEIDNIMNMLNN